MCLISSAANDVGALCTSCPLIGLCRSLHLETHAVPHNPPPEHKQANPVTELRGWGGEKQPQLG